MLTGSTIKKELNELKKTEHKLRNMIDAGPEGSLYYRRSRSGKREDIPYLRIGRGAKYQTKSLSGADPGYLGALKRKTYALHLLPFIKARRKMLEKAAGYAPVPGHIKNYGGEPFRDCYEEIFGKVPENPAFEALQERQNPEYRDELKFMTALGTFRSKNEALFADRLDSLSLHFKYETPLDIEMYRYFPDFVVLHPKTGNLIYIEFCGRLDDPVYRKRLAWKIEQYAKHGIYLGINFFVFAEHPKNGLDMEEIERILKAVFDL